MMTTEARLRSRARAARWRALCRERRFRISRSKWVAAWRWMLKQRGENLRIADEWRALAERKDHDHLWFSVRVGFLAGVVTGFVIFLLFGRS